MAKLLRTNGVEVEIAPAKATDEFSVDEIFRLLGNDLHLLPLDSERIMVMHARISGRRPMNQGAMGLLLRALAIRQAPARDIDIVRGDVLVATYAELRQVIRSGALLL